MENIGLGYNGLRGVGRNEAAENCDVRGVIAITVSTLDVRFDFVKELHALAQNYSFASCSRQ